jgi:ABC-type bacteriocin/lantibiotic exporter with double-glycine peptidase domain
MLLLNSDKLSEINFTKLNTPIYRISNSSFNSLNLIINTIIPNITLLIIIFIYFFYKNYLFGTIFLIGNLIVLIYLYNVVPIIFSYNQNLEKVVSQSESFIGEILNNIDKIIFRGNIENELNEQYTRSDNTINSSIEFYSNAYYHIIIMILIISVTVISLIFILINYYYSNKIDKTLFITFFTILLLYRDLFINCIQELPTLIEIIGRSNADEINNISDDYMKVLNKKYKDYKLDFNKIEFHNIKFKYKNSNNYILDDFNLKINTENKIVGIVGLSGNGKSTFAKLLIKLYKYDGNIFIDEINIKNIDPLYIRKNIIYVNQNSKLFDRKIIDNILYGCNDLDKCNEQLQEILNNTKIKDLFKNINFYEKNAGYSGENLSGGQRQIINIINGLITPSNVVILDEPTNGLDIELKNNIIDIIKYFRKYKKCIIIISHDSDIFKLFDEKITIS